MGWFTKLNKNGKLNDRHILCSTSVLYHCLLVDELETGNNCSWHCKLSNEHGKYHVSFASVFYQPSLLMGSSTINWELYRKRVRIWYEM